MAEDKSSTTYRASSSVPLSPAARPLSRTHNISYSEPRKSHTPEAPAAAVARRSTERETEDINVSADAFIQRFRQQLQLQRLESIENYRQMLARGT